MATTTYRYVGEAAEVFAPWSSLIEVEGVDAGAAPWVDGHSNDNYQPPGELRPGQTFTGPSDLLGDVGHARIERRNRGGKWVSTTTGKATAAEPEAEPVDTDTEPEA